MSEVKREFSKGHLELPDCGDKCWSGAIDVDNWGARIECYGMTKLEAEGLRDEVFTALSHLAALREELAKSNAAHEVAAENHGLLNAEIFNLEQRLADAERRNAIFIGMLKHFASCADVRQVGTLAMDAVAALNKPEEAKS